MTSRQLLSSFKKHQSGFVDLSDPKLVLDNKAKYAKRDKGPDNIDYRDYRLLGVYQYSQDIGILFNIANCSQQINSSDCTLYEVKLSPPTQIINALVIRKGKPLGDQWITWVEMRSDFPESTVSKKYFTNDGGPFSLNDGVNFDFAKFDEFPGFRLLKVQEFVFKPNRLTIHYQDYDYIAQSTVDSNKKYIYQYVLDFNPNNQKFVFNEMLSKAEQQ